MNATTRTMTNLLGAALIATMSVACSERTEDKVEQKADNAANATGNAVANGGRAADAAVETMDVKVALTTDTRVDASNINVDSDHVTKTVTLKGYVPTAEQKTLAGQIATREAAGVTVDNRIRVDAAVAGSAARPVNVDDVEERVEDALEADSTMRAFDLDVDEENGQLVLEGKVPTAAQRTLAEGLVKRIAGTVTVVNRIKVEP